MKFESYSATGIILTKNIQSSLIQKQISLLIKKQGKHFVQIPRAIYTARDS